MHGLWFYAGFTAGPVSNEEDSPGSSSPTVFFQQEGCPYSVSEQEAADLFNSTSEPGNVILVEEFGVGMIHPSCTERAHCFWRFEVQSNCRIEIKVKPQPATSTEISPHLRRPCSTLCLLFSLPPLQGEPGTASKVYR